jgi:hypothetical protein
MERKTYVSVALLVRLEAKPGKEAEVERFIRDGLSIVQGEPGTTAWFGIRMGHLHLASLMPFQTSQVVKRICQVELLQL